MDLLKLIRKGDIEKMEKKVTTINVNEEIKEYDNVRRTYCFTIPLCLAAAKGNVKLVTLLLDNGADINASNKAWNAPLLLSTSCGYVQMMELLISRGADVNRADAHGNTPLHEATRASRVGCVILLLKYDVSVTMTNHEGQTAYDLAKKLKTSTIADLLKKKIGRLSQDERDTIKFSREDKEHFKNRKTVRFSEDVVIITYQTDSEEEDAKVMKGTTELVSKSDNNNNENVKSLGKLERQERGEETKTNGGIASGKVNGTSSVGKVSVELVDGKGTSVNAEATKKESKVTTTKLSGEVNNGNIITSLMTKLEKKELDLEAVNSSLVKRKDKMNSLLQEIKNLQTQFKEEKRNHTTDEISQAVLSKEVILLKEKLAREKNK